MPSDAWMTGVACSSGRPRPAVIRRNRMACWLSIPSSFATPGSRALPRSPRWSLSASGWSRFSTCRPRSLRNSARSSANWSRTPSGESSRLSSYRTAGFASRRTLAAAAPTSGCVWAGRNWSRPPWCGGQEPKTLVGLTSLRTENPPMLPKLNAKRARFVLTKIDEILAWEQRKEAERDTRFVELGRYLCEVRAGQYWRLDNLKSFDEFLERRFPESRRKAYYLMSIHEHLPPQVRKELKQVGWTKGRELAKLARRMDRQPFDCAIWLHKARSLPTEQFKREVERELTGRDTEPWEIIYFKLYKSQIPVVEQAIETAALMLGTDKSRGYCLEMICADFLAGANLCESQPDIMVVSLERLYQLLPKPQQAELLKRLGESSWTGCTRSN